MTWGRYLGKPQNFKVSNKNIQPERDSEVFKDLLILKTPDLIFLNNRIFIRWIREHILAAHGLSYATGHDTFWGFNFQV